MEWNFKYIELRTKKNNVGIILSSFESDLNKDEKFLHRAICQRQKNSAFYTGNEKPSLHVQPRDSSQLKIFIIQ